MSFDLPPDSSDEGNVPDWLKDLQSEDSFSDAPEDDLFSSQSDQDNPEWLGEADDTGVYTSPTEPEEKDVPTWLSSIREAESVQSPSGEETPSDSPSAEGGDSDWMQNIREKETSTTEPEPPHQNGDDLLSRIQSLQTAEETKTGDQEDWLSGLAQEQSSENDAPFSIDPGAGGPDAPNQPAEAAAVLNDLGGDATLLDAEIPDFYKHDPEPGQKTGAGAEGAFNLNTFQPEGEMPDFFSGEPDTGGESAAGDDSSDWLGSLAGDDSASGELDAAPQPAAEPPVISGEPSNESAAPAAEDSDHDGWFDTVEEEEEDPMDWFTGEDAGDEEDLPEWVQKMEAKSPFKEIMIPDANDNDQAAPQSPAADSSSDWLADQAGGFDPGPSGQARDPDSGGSPSWLANLQDDKVGEGGQSTPAAGDSQVIEISDYSFDADAASLLDPSDLPDWLDQSAPDQQAQELVIQPDLPSPLPPRDESEISRPEPPPAQPAGDVSDISRADLPSWLQAIRPDEESLTPVETPEDSPAGFTEEAGPLASPLAGPLAGLSGVLPAEPGLIAAGKPAATPADNGVSKTIQQFAQMLETMVASEGQVQPVRRWRLALPGKIIKLGIAVLLYAIVFLPVFFGTKIISMPLPAAMPPESQAVFATIESISPGALVLIAFEYQPGYSGELAAAAAPVVNHLLNKGGFPVLISSQPTGPALGENFLQTTQSHQPAIFNHNYVNLGYVSGGGAALLNFASDPRRAVPLPTADGLNRWDQVPLQTVRGIRDFALVLVLTDDPDRARAWVEQVQPALVNPDDPASTTPLLMVVSAQAEPMVFPYYHTSPPQVTGLVSGTNGGAYYEVQTNTQGPATTYWTSYNIGLLTAILILITGGGVNLVRFFFTPRSAKGTRP